MICIQFTNLTDSFQSKYLDNYDVIDIRHDKKTCKSLIYLKK